MCCLTYEHDAYLQARKRFPREGKLVRTARGQEKVIGIDIWHDQVTLLDETKQRRVITLAELKSGDRGGDARGPRCVAAADRGGGEARRPRRGEAGAAAGEPLSDPRENGAAVAASVLVARARHAGRRRTEVTGGRG
jgi:hypothetical protein